MAELRTPSGRMCVLEPLPEAHVPAETGPFHARLVLPRTQLTTRTRKRVAGCSNERAGGPVSAPTNCRTPSGDPMSDVLQLRNRRLSNSTSRAVGSWVPGADTDAPLELVGVSASADCVEFYMRSTHGQCTATLSMTRHHSSHTAVESGIHSIAEHPAGQSWIATTPRPG
jgi:hypothetical protein